MLHLSCFCYFNSIYFCNNCNNGARTDNTTFLKKCTINNFSRRKKICCHKIYALNYFCWFSWKRMKRVQHTFKSWWWWLHGRMVLFVSYFFCFAMSSRGGGFFFLFIKCFLLFSSVKSRNWKIEIVTWLLRDWLAKLTNTRHSDSKMKRKKLNKKMFDIRTTTTLFRVFYYI